MTLLRLLPAVVAGAVLAGAAWLLRIHGPQGLGLPGCPFHQLTGLDCPGCGLTRATYASLHGRFAEAFRLNPLGVILLPLAAVGTTLEIAAWVTQNPGIPRWKAGSKGSRALLILLLIYWIVRNLPWWPFPLP